MSEAFSVAAVPGTTVSFGGFPPGWRAAIASFLSGFDLADGPDPGAELRVEASVGPVGDPEAGGVEWLVSHPPLRAGRGPFPDAVRLALPGSVTDIAADSGSARVAIVSPEDRAAPLDFVAFALVPLLQELAAPRGVLGVHAAAVAWKGNAVLLAGPSACGKSTLFARAAQAGLDLLSDDLVWLVPERDGWAVRPFPRGAPAAPAPPPTVASARLARLARPVIDGGPVSRVSPLPVAAAIELLGSEAPVMAPGGAEGRFRAIVRIAGAVPAFRFHASAGAADAAERMRTLLGD